MLPKSRVWPKSFETSPPAMIELPSISFCQIQDCSKDMDVNGCINTVKTKDWDARSSLSPLSNKD